MGFLSPPSFFPMLSKQQAGAWIIKAPAKVNLFLEVLAKRADGYHEIATLMVAVNLYDTLKFKEEASGEIRVDCDHPQLSTGPDNLVSRAATLLKARTGCRRGARIRLSKRIPLAAGLAGGSTDAAATLDGLNRLWDLGLTKEELATLGSEVGSDVAFFFSAPAAWCTGRGEQVSQVPLGKPLSLALICLPIGLSTAAVYSRVTVPDSPQRGEEIRRAVKEGNVEEIGRRLHNRLQVTAEKLCPEVKDLCCRLAELRPAGHLMSGSGPCVFALCRDRGQALRIARLLRHGAEGEVGPSVFVVHSCT
jgi:4-diphosphocytidyl-2-C-methyl-D-erythritol kinase